VDAVGPLTVVADRRRVEEIVTNLIENAVRYSPAGRPVRIRLQPQPDVARVEVIDRGPGIAPEDRTRIFDRFYRAARDRPHRGHHGLGLGLYVAREMVERHGGAIGVDATPGGGSTFWFTLPYDQS
jgi:signal transduction histidine kinase